MRIPKYRKNSARDSAFVEWRGKRHYLPGRFDSAESKRAYRQFIRNNITAEPGELDADGLTVECLLLAYLDHALKRYGDGLRGEYANCRFALKPLISSEHGQILAVKFGPKRLKQWRDAIVAGQSRHYVNQQIGKIKRAFKWAASEELIPVGVHQALATVTGLYAGETAAKETPRRQPVAWEHVEATCAFLSPLVADMVRVQRMTGVRSQSLCRAKPEQFDRTGELWLWRPRHKNEFRGVELVIPVGPKCQAILVPYMDRDPAAHLFDPRTQRKNARYNSHYTTSSYYHAIHRGIERANAKRLACAAENRVPAEVASLIPEWFPHQMRHARGQEVRERYGIEGSQAILGHDSLDATQIYTSRRLELAKQIARETG